MTTSQRTAFSRVGGEGRKAYVVTLIYVQVRVHVPSVRAVYSPRHAWPRLLESKYTLDIVTVDLLARNRVDNGRLNTEEGERCRARLRWGHARQWGNNVGASLGLPVSLLKESIS